VIVQQERALERGRRTLERLTEDPDDDRPGVEFGERVAHALGSRDGIELETALRKAWHRRHVVVGAQCNREHVRVVRAFARRHAPRLRIDRRHPLLAELDAVFGDVAVGEQHVGGRFPAEQDVELREPEAERVVLVDERDTHLVGERIGEPGRELQAREAGPEDHHVLPVHAAGGRY
jgi:hypothetical protein